MHRFWSHIATIVVGLAWAHASQGADLRLGVQGALLQQPTSHYYHYAYGLTVDGAFSKAMFIVRTSYVRRPAFDSYGFIDTEQGAMLHFGTSVWNKRRHRLLAFGGVGWVEGKVVAKASELRARESGRLSTVAGPSLGAEYRLEFGSIDFHVGHTTVIGMQDQAQLAARVAWPYNFYSLGMATTW